MSITKIYSWLGAKASPVTPRSLEGLRRGQKADVLGKVTNVTVKDLKDGSAKGEVWLKDDSDRLVLCEMWGKTFASLAKDMAVGQVVRAINFSVVTHDGKSISLTGEFFADSERGSAMLEVVLAGEQVERLASVQEEGGEAMSTPWTAPQSSKMIYTGTCFVSCLASVKNSILVSSTADTMASQGSAAASESRPFTKESLKEEIRVFVPGVWLTDVRDQDPVFHVCESSRLKIDAVTGLCRKSGEACQCKAAAEPLLLTSVSLRVTVQQDEFCVLVRTSTLQDVQDAILETGISSLTFQRRCDVILGSNKYVSSGDWTHAQFQVLRAEEQLLAPVNTEMRPLPSYVYLTEDAAHGQVIALSSLAKVPESPGGARVEEANGVVPASVFMLVTALDRAKALQLDEKTIQVSHDRVRSLLHADESAEFRVEALATLSDMFVFNLQNMIRIIVGSLRFRKGVCVFMADRIFSLPDGLSEEDAKNIMETEIGSVAAVEKRSGNRRRAGSLMEATPAKKT
ncbi:unnamed protein product [Symbiodinium sp. CCMP2592]|nr:unnamed protein product [Symbiodinium sp. CCMP2592]